jgi:hypothetical protein
MSRSLPVMTLRLLAAAALAALAAGCMRSEQDLTLNLDGSFDLKMSFAYDEKAWAEFGKLLEASIGGKDTEDRDVPPQLDPLIKEAETRAKLEAAKAAGVEVRSFKVEKAADGWLGETLDAHCRDLAALNAALRALGNEEEFALKRNADGTFTLASKGRESPLPFAQELGKEESAEERKKLKGFKVISAITVPGEITETNAHAREGRKARWTVDAADKDFLAKVKTMVGKDDSVTFKADGFKLPAGESHRYIRNDLTLALNADGSVDVAERKSVHDAFFKEAEARAVASQGNADGLRRMFDEQAVRDEFRQDRQEGEKAGIELKNVKAELSGGWRRITVETHCRDLAAARAAVEVSEYALVRSADGNYLLTISPAEDPKQAMPELPAMKGMIRKMWELQRLYITVRVPGDVIVSTAHEVNGRELKWAYDVTDPKFDEKLADMGKKGRIVSFKGAGLDLKEVKAEPRPGMTPAHGYRDGGGRKKPVKPPPEGEAPTEPAPAPPAPAPEAPRP